MSIEVDWGAATSGPDGEALAERIRSFIHDKFQQVPLPRFIRSVQVHSFDFGTIAPDLEIKDFCEPFADFYEDDYDVAASDTSEELQHPSQDNPWSDLNESGFRGDIPITGHRRLRDPFDADYRHNVSSPLHSPVTLGDHLNPPFLPRAATPGIPGGTSTLGYHLMSLGGLSGTQTPLAAVAGGSPFAGNWPDSPGQGNRSGNRPSPHHHRAFTDIDSSNPTSRPSTASTHPPGSNKNSGDAASHPDEHLAEDPTQPSDPLQLPRRMRERRPEDLQVLCHVNYAGDIRLSLTAEILLDYPMPSFVGLPLKLNVTGITFDGVAVVAYIRKRIHFCFLSPEDADALVGSPNPGRNQLEQGAGTGAGGGSCSSDPKQKGLGLLQEIRVESEIGRKEDGKQVLKNVGKVERFVLAQVRRIFEEELVFPSFWTFLV
ncbi:ERMES complex subunit MDM12 [Aspergillus lucknowensis]|uniref:Mitochondrial distribution and morphology protein 12 n=1 Tax=Aspergillus lucknowensis TaxID=176173 RepID=A0ABR4LH36_9EURO